MGVILILYLVVSYLIGPYIVYRFVKNNTSDWDDLDTAFWLLFSLVSPLIIVVMASFCMGVLLLHVIWLVVGRVFKRVDRYLEKHFKWMERL